MHLTATEYVIAGAGLGIIAIIAAGARALLNDIVSYLLKEVVSLFVVSIEMDDSAELMYYLKHHAKAFTMNRGYYSTAKEWVKPLARLSTVFRRSAKMSHTLFFYRKAPVLVSPAVPRANGGSGWAPPRVWFFRGTVAWKELLLAAAAFYDDKAADNFKNKTRRFSFTRHTGNRGGAEVVAANSLRNGGESPPGAPQDNSKSGSDNKGSGPLASTYVGWTEDDIGMPPAQKLLLQLMSLGPQERKILQAAEFWYSHEEWYEERGIAWRLGCLLFGKPGGGKTSLARAIGEHLDLPMHLFDLASMTNRDFIAAWLRARQDGARIIILEDLCDVFELRENKLEGGLTFDALLNVLDGVEREHGLLLFVTTNKVHFIDEALGAPLKDAKGHYTNKTTRPGRLDIAVELEGFDYARRLKIARRILKDEGESVRISTEGEGDTPGQFQDRCVKYAIEKLWNEKTPVGDFATEKPEPYVKESDA